MKKTATTHWWILFQDTKDGRRYFTGRAHPISPDAWAKDIRKAKRMDWTGIVNMREWLSANTWGDTVKMLKERAK
jgi:hypothetical protein